MSNLNDVIENTYQATTEEWRAEAVEIITDLALTRPTFSADDVWASGLERPKNSRALGGAFQRARNLGLIEPTNTFVKSIYDDHYGTRRVWRSTRFVTDTSLVSEVKSQILELIGGSDPELETLLDGLVKAAENRVAA
ncbi:hypothetical protein KGG93_gp61 [Streptomyces phage Endor2]|uniref:Uncharacterized protein n=1 Tax=Streptomyces phage Endor2 TaxID=2740182 RepID=A0A7G4AX66_9CAUD|nr:hypothetical protein KGG93_gp61 [Streptomyces phage Endor2]QMP84606.1 hypothetical protein HUN44_00061 [Streptomyces phage Endor2]